MTTTIQSSPLVPRVLLVIDQPVLAQYTTLALSHSSCITSIAQNVDETTTALRQWQPHLAVIDMDIAQGEILNLLGYTVPTAERTPAIALTRQGGLKPKLEAFERGIDDILTVPFCPEELVARILAVMRRTYQATLSFTPVLRLGDLEIDIMNRLVRVHGTELHLTAIEQSLLYLLAANAGQLLTRDVILDQLWGTDYMAESNVVDRHIRNLRIKLQDGWRKPRYIVTVPGRGYCFVPTTANASDAS